MKPIPHQSKNRLTGCISIRKAAEILLVSLSALRKWDRMGILKAYRNPKNNYRLYHINDLQKFAQEKGLKSKPKRILKD
ncbi:MAG: MerR family DNA-binding transcriptional regulator [Patescibacteria group bacterium]